MTSFWKRDNKSIKDLHFWVSLFYVHICLSLARDMKIGNKSKNKCQNIIGRYTFLTEHKNKNIVKQTLLEQITCLYFTT